MTGLSNYTSEEVITGINRYMANSSHPLLFEPPDVQKIKADAGSQFTAQEFRDACANSHIALSLAAPKHQEQNHYAERTWQTVNNIADRIMVHARLPPTFKYFAVLYAICIFNVTPVKYLRGPKGNPITPFEYFHSKKPLIQHYRVFGCPVVFRKWTIPAPDGTSRENKTSQRGVRGIFIGFPPTSKDT